MRTSNNKKRSSRSRVLCSSGGTVSSAKAIRNRRLAAGSTTAQQEVVPFSSPNFISEKMQGIPPRNYFRESEYLHVSDLLHTCMRKIALSEHASTPLVGDAIWDSQDITFAMGRAIEQVVRTRLIRSSSDILYGTWSCVCGAATSTGVHSDALQHGACSVCGTEQSNYQEMVLRNEEYMLQGSVDVTLLFDLAYYLTEVKSIKKEDWQALSRPLPIHILQVIFYWWMSRQKRLPMHRQVSILYVSKGQVRGTPFKEFTINPEEHLERLAPYLTDATALKEARAGGSFPCRTCDGIETPAAKRCERRVICFGMGD